MKGKTPSKAAKQLWSKLANIGCIACLKDGNHNALVSIHHIAGRTRQGVHHRVLPLCGQHHQHDDTDPLRRIGVHPYKARFEAKYGKQSDLLAECMELIEPTA